MNKQKAKDNALLRIIANKRDQNFATRRILRDLREIESNTITTVGVTARPLSKNFFEWHANIKGPEGTIYEGGVFHLSLKIPENYPHQPPTVELLTSLPHPNVFGSYICLDMLNPMVDGSGWTSAYTIQSILMQLQSFLFQKQLKRDEKQFEQEVKFAIERANEFKCRACNHGGKLSAWPKFNEKETDESAFQLVNFNESQEFFKEIICYHTKSSFKDSIDENKDTVKGYSLGLGMKITKIPRTGAIQQAITTLDYISIKAFIKEGIRWSCNNEKFTTWFPLYFGNEDNKSRSLKLGQKAISMIMTNSTRRFKPEYVLEVFPKIVISQILLLADEKRHPSIVMIRNLTHIHSMFLLFMEEYPELYDVIEERLQNFINEESKRVKEVLPNLSLIMTYLLVSPKTKLKQVLTPYHLESLDRQVFWILRSVPEIFELPNKKESQKEKEGQKNTGLNAERAKLTFKCQIISNQMFSLFKLYISTVRSDNDTPKDLLNNFEANYCRLSDKIENEIQRNIKQIKKIDNYDDFYAFIGFPKKSLEELNGMLLKAYKNSAAKKYHGNINEIHTLPTTKDQMEKLYQKIPKIEDFYEIKTSEEIVDDKKEFKYLFKLKKEMAEQDWKAAAQQRWIWLAEELKTNPDVSPTVLLANNYKNYNLNQPRQPPQIFENIKNNWRKRDTKVEYPFIQITEQSWHSLFISLDIQDTLYYMNENPDFTTFYQKLAVSKDILTFLTIPIIRITQIKSGYHFLTALLSKLTNLKYITVTGTGDSQTPFPMKAITSFNKGINNFLKAKGSLQGIFFNGLGAQGNSAEITDKIFSPLAQMKELISIKFVNNNFIQQLNAPKSLGKIIAELKNLQELILSNNVFYNPTQAKEIADSLMRAKKLKYIDISQNSSMGFQGLASIIYNLSFSTNLYYLNISKNYCSGNINEVSEALYKLLKINASIELLDISVISDLNNKLTKDFFQCLGDIPSLRYVNFECSGFFNSSNLGLLGKSVAFSARKNNALENLGLQNTISNFSSVENYFYENMKISDHDYETWYGDPIKASKMKGSDYTKVYYNNLKSLQFNNAQNFASYFNITDFQKYNRKDTNFMKLTTQSPNITTLSLSQCQLRKQDADLLSLVLDPTREIKNFVTKIQILDISKNQIGKEGAKVFAKIFEVNNILEVVDLSKNQIGVSGAQEIAKYLQKNKTLKFLNLFNNKIGYDGAKAFAETLKVNTSLEFLELGHNRIRKEGLKEIGESLSENAQTKLQVLGLRFNFLGEDGITEFQKKTAKVASLKEIFVKNNSVGEYGLQQIKKVYDNLKSTLKIDLLEKLDYLGDEKLEKTIFIHPVPGSNSDIKRFFEEQQNCGIILDIRVRFGPKWPNRTQHTNRFAMVEFADTKSVDRALMVAAKKRANINGQNFRIYKAGTGTFIYMKKSTKQKKAETSKTNFLKLGEGGTTTPPPVFNRTRDARGGGRGGRGGRGRGGRRR